MTHMCFDPLATFKPHHQSNIGGEGIDEIFTRFCFHAGMKYVYLI